MRIIGGSLRRRRLADLEGRTTRPTSDRLRQTLFDILGPIVAGSRVLDGYAGTGALGLEALSRGAREAVFVEFDRTALATLTENIRRCDVGATAVLRRGRYPEAVQAEAPFDVILLDPPYDTASLPDVVRPAEALLAPNGVAVLEHSRRREPPAEVGKLNRTRVVKAGDSALSFYRFPAGEPRAAND